jgi:hypothetical protein
MYMNSKFEFWRASTRADRRNDGRRDGQLKPSQLWYLQYYENIAALGGCCIHWGICYQVRPTLQVVCFCPSPTWGW